MNVDRVVIGGGFAGLLSAHSALSLGESVVVLEASSDWGGAIGRGVLGHQTIDTGAEAFSLMGNAVSDLIDRLGLSQQVRKPRALSPVIAGANGLLPIPRGVMGIPADLDELRASTVLDTNAIDTAAQRDAVPMGPGWMEKPLGDLVGERLGASLLNQLVVPIVNAIYGPNAVRCTLGELLPSFAAEVQKTGSLTGAAAAVRGNSPGPGSAVASLKGGLHTLIDALSAECRSLGGALHANSPVTRLEREGTTWSVGTDETTFHSPRVTLACGLGATQKLLGTQQEFASILRPLETHATTIVFALVNDSLLNSFPLGTGALVAKDFAGHLHATTHANAKWEWLDDTLPPDHHLIRLSFASPLDQEIGQVKTAALQALADLYATHPDNVREMLPVRWGDNLVEHNPGSKALRNQLTELAGHHGLDIRGAVASGNGLLAITQDVQRKENPWLTPA